MVSTMEARMANASALEAERQITPTPRPTRAAAGASDGSPTAFAELPSMAPKHGLRLNDAQDLLLIQMRYDEHLAREGLRELFENGELECLCA
jgi:hypothetical protein